MSVFAKAPSPSIPPPRGGEVGERVVVKLPQYINDAKNSVLQIKPIYLSASTSKTGSKPLPMLVFQK
jgi:hypothetical protein